MRRATSIAAVLLLAVLGSPGPAAAAPADCGTTADQWVGTFTGTEDAHRGTPATLTVTVTLTAGELEVDTVTVDPYNDPVSEDLQDGRLVWKTGWYVRGPWGSYGDTDTYTTTSVTCAGGQVTAMAGTLEVDRIHTDSDSGTFSVSR